MVEKLRGATPNVVRLMRIGAGRARQPNPIAHCAREAILELRAPAIDALHRRAAGICDVGRCLREGLVVLGIVLLVPRHLTPIRVRRDDDTACSLHVSG